MKAKYIGKSSCCVTNGKVYDVELYGGYYHLIDDVGDNNSYHRDEFELVEGGKPAPLIDGPGLYRTEGEPSTDDDIVEKISSTPEPVNPVAADPFPFRPADDVRWYPPFKEGDNVTHRLSGESNVIKVVATHQCHRDVDDDFYGPRYVMQDGSMYDWRWFIDPPQPTFPVKQEDQPLLRQFSSGATRNLDNNKYDYEGFLSPLVIEAFGKYMHSHRLQKDGTMRDSDNWQKGIPFDVYMKSGWRHFFDWWKLHRGVDAVSPEDGHKIDKVEALCALMFNVQGYMHELLKEQSNV